MVMIKIIVSGNPSKTHLNEFFIVLTLIKQEFTVFKKKLLDNYHYFETFEKRHKA